MRLSELFALVEKYQRIEDAAEEHVTFSARYDRTELEQAAALGRLHGVRQANQILRQIAEEVLVEVAASYRPNECHAILAREDAVNLADFVSDVDGLDPVARLRLHADVEASDYADFPEGRFPHEVAGRVAAQARLAFVEMFIRDMERPETTTVARRAEYAFPEPVLRVA